MGTGGGGGGLWSGGNGTQGAGGSGIVVVRYQIGSVQSYGGNPVQKLLVDLLVYNSKVIHTFTSSGTFTAPIFQ